MAYALDQDTIDQFDSQRKRAAQENNAAVQTQKDALKRRFASMGSLNSGAALKQDQLTEQQGQDNLNKANEQIAAAQNAEGRRQKEVGEGRDFARTEREASQNFGASQADLQRRFMSGEREAGQGFAASQADLQRQFASGERKAGQDFATGERIGAQGFSADQANQARELQKSQFGQQMDQARLNFEEEKFVNRANIDFNERMLNQKDMIERLLGNIGLGGLFSEDGSGGGSIINKGAKVATGFMTGGVAGGLF